MLIYIMAQLIAWGASAAWLIFFYSLDKHEKESFKDLFRVFFLGAAFGIPAGFINILGERLFFGASPGNGLVLHLGPVIATILYYIFVVGIGEELCKFLAVWVGIYKKPQFNEPLDGIIYASAACLGFAFIENIEYFSSFLFALSENELSLADVSSAVVGRSLLVVPLHVLLGSFWGYNLGLAKFRPKRKTRLIISGLAFAAIIHGVYNITILLNISWFGVVVFIGILSWFFFKKVRYLARTSPFNQCKYGILCPECKSVIKTNSAFCSFCGVETKKNLSEQRLCLKCHAAIKGSWTYCQNCGEKLTT